MRDHWSKQRIRTSTVNMLRWTTRLFIIIGLLEFFFPDLIPFGFWDMWRLGDGDVYAAIYDLRLLFLVPAGLSTLGVLAGIASKQELPRLDFRDVMHISFRAGILEEVIFRWLLFYSVIASLRILDFLFFRFMFGFSVDEIIYTNLLMPLANLTTLGLMSHFIFQTAGWFVGAAIISSNGKFRNGHSYQGLFGWTMSWFMGMLLFYITFTHGLLAAIVIHTVYDIVALGTTYLLRVTVARKYQPQQTVSPILRQLIEARRKNAITRIRRF